MLRRNKKIIVLCLLTFMFNHVQAINNPGYVGKKNVISIGYNPYFIGLSKLSTSILGFNFNEDEILNRNMIHGLTLDVERTISSRLSLGFAHVGYQFQAQQILNGPFLDKDGKSIIFFNRAGAEYGLKYSHWHVNLKIYNKGKGSIAPLGRYIGFTYGQSTSTFSDMVIYEYDQFNNNHFDKSMAVKTMDQSFKFTLPNVGMEIGANRVIKDKILLGYFVNISIRTKAIFDIPFKGLGGYDDPGIDNDYLSSLKTVNARQNFMRMGVKAGFLF